MAARVRTVSNRTFLVRVALVVFAAAVLVLPRPTGAQQATSVEVQILAFNDFHGNLEPPTGNIGGQPAGGAQFLATHIANFRAQNPDNTVVVHAGDAIGASPLLSALFHDEVTIESLGLMGLDYAGVGNHEFDEGVTELQRMQNGGCHPVDGCLAGHIFAGAEFQFLAANVRRISTGETVFPPYAIREFAGGVKVAFIGMTLEGTPRIVSPGGILGYEFLDEAETVNALVPLLQAQGVETFVVVIHQSAGSGGSGSQGFNACGSSGNSLVSAMSQQIDLVVSGHSHAAYNCVFNGIPVTQASSFGRLLTEIDLTISTETGNPVSMVVNNRIVTRTVPPDPAQLELIARYQAVAGPIANRVIGSITADINRTGNSAGEQPLGDLISDSHVWAAQPEGAQIGFMNTGGIRTNLLFSQQSGDEAPGEVTYGENFAVQPFGNNLTTLTMTGAQIDRLLEQQFQGGNGILQISAGFTYTQWRHRPAGDRIPMHTIRLNGVPLDPDGTYRVVANSFLADGGDGYTVFTEGVERTGGVVDSDGTAAYFTAFSPISPPLLNRITRVDSAAAADAGVAIAAPATAVFGEPFEATVTAYNDGPAEAAGVTLVATLPAGSDFVSASGGGTYDAAARTVSWGVGALALQGSSSFTVTLRGVATGPATTAATVSTTSSDPGAANNTRSAATTILPLPFTGVVAPGGKTAVKAGSSVPFTFSLVGDRGLAVLAEGSPASQRVTCDQERTPLGPSSPTATAGKSRLAYDADADAYRYVWKTDESWRGTCRRLTLTLVDGEEHAAYFEFAR